MGMPPDPSQQQPGSYGQQLPPYDPSGTQPQYGQQPNPYQHQYAQSAKPTSGTQTFSIIAFVMAGLSLIILPIIFGPVGVILGIIGHRKGEKLGVASAITAGVAAVISTIIAAIILSS